MCCVPTLLSTIDEELPGLRLLIVSGEACPEDLITRWHSPKRTILNAYGPTETTVTATLARPRPNEPVTIGKPLPTYSIVILEPGTEKVIPFGEVGEIAIAGVGVARGYQNREDQTRKAFIKDFLNIPNNPSGLIYRTGDLARINENGDIEYRGRIDTQVKIRGYRIELTEIESVILQIPQIGQAVVNTFESIQGVKELVAYYTLKADAQRLPQEELVDVLRSLLPNYMVPAFYEYLAEMPMMASDKADRKALPEPSGLRMNVDGNHTFVEPQSPLEKDIARVLACLLKLEAVSVEDNFFDDLGANSLLMAQFSARLRSELGISDFSMREIYTCPSVRKLSEFLESTGQKRMPLRRDNPSHKATNWQYILTGIAQLGFIFAWAYGYMFLLWKGYAWIIEAPDSLNAYGRTLLFSTLLFALSVLLPVGLKWLLIGKWKAEEFPVWSLRYLRFWIVKFLIHSNPMAAFVGSPLYNGYLKLLGARVSWKAFIQSGFPVCTDLLSIGEGVVVYKRAILTGYRAESGRIRTGGITLERDAFVGEAAVLDIDTVMEAGSELAHASSLRRGQRLKAGKYYHGSPAQPTANRYRQLEKGTVSVTRMALFSLVQLVLMFLVFVPLPMLIIYNFLGADHNHSSTKIADLLPETVTLSHLLDLVTWTSLLYVVFILAGLVFIILMPRFLNLFLKEDKVYPLYGVHYVIHRMLEGISNSASYNILFGDSSYIVYFLGAIGYKFKGMEQTGSNFGLSHQHDNPFLSEFGKGSMISDGFALLNAAYSAKSFKLSRASISANNFVGNNIVYPARAKVGENCLLGTKVMVPTHGPVREHVGLLGSPCFEIPRSVRRDRRFDAYKRKDVLGKRLKQKNISNLMTMLFVLLSNLIALNMLITIWLYTYLRFIKYEALYIYRFVHGCGSRFLFFYYILVDRATLGFRPLQPEYCSIYDKYYWKHERYWKLGFSNRSVIKGIFGMLSGTPLKGVLWRGIGVKVGKKLFDDGTYISEKSLVYIGDYCTLNGFSVLQCHSLEDGTFKSDYSFIGNECTIGVNAFVHYGVDMQNDVTLEPDSFLMKGEHPDAHSIWQGNPAKAMLAEIITLNAENNMITDPISTLDIKQVTPHEPLAA